jgi:hypothetical protein
MIPQIDNVALAILKGAYNPETKDLIVDLGQLELGSLAALLGEDVLKEIPMIKGVVACFKIPLAIRDQLFLRKVAGFLAGCPRFTEAEKKAFLDEYLSDDKKAKKLGDSLMLILDRLDDMEKPQMVAKIFAAFIRGKIRYDIFRRLATAIDLGSVADLWEFVKIEPTPTTGQRVSLNPQTQLLRTNLVRTGLVSLPSFTQTTPILGVSFSENDLGKTFKEIMNDTQPHST